MRYLIVRYPRLSNSPVDFIVIVGIDGVSTIESAVLTLSVVLKESFADLETSVFFCPQLNKNQQYCK